MDAAKHLWKRLKKEGADPAAVKEAKAKYKALKKGHGAAAPAAGVKRARELEAGPTAESAVADGHLVASAKAAWKALKAQGADKTAVKAAKAAYKAAKAARATSAVVSAGEGATKKQKTGADVANLGNDDTTGAPTGPSFDTFAATPFSTTILASLTAAGFSSPTAIQARAWPIVLTGADLIAIAKTGSGKTLAFLLPAFHRLASSHQSGQRSDIPSPEILIVAPTRELCMQIAAAAQQFGGTGSNMTTHAIYGGVPVHPMKVRLQKERPRVVVATCGRLIDLLERRCLSLARCSYVVLDEADRMLDMGFEPEMKKIFAALPQEDGARQTLLFSATWPKSIRKLAAKFLRGDAQQLFIGNVSQDGELEANKAISQTFIQATDDEKERRLFDILNDLKEKKAAADDKVPADYNAIVFANTKNRVDRLTRVFWDWEFGTCAVHGGKRQDERDKALAKFVSKECPVMFATDVAARGLDIKGVTHVINFDMARDVESYVHRIGRTGRAGELGDAITFWNPDYDKACSPALVAIARKAGQEIPKFLAKYEKVKASKQWSSAKAEKASAGVF